MLLSTEKLDGVVFARLHMKAVEFGNFSDARRVLWPLIDPRSKLALNLEDLSVLDAAGLSLFMKWIRETQAAGMNVCLYNLTKQVRIMFEMMMLHQAVPVCESKQEALLYFGAPENQAEPGSQAAAV